MSINRPIIGITADTTADKFQIARAYVAIVEQAGGAPLVLPCLPTCVPAFISCCHGIVLTGGGDPIMTDPRLGGIPMHPKANPIDPQRQAFELALLDALQRNPAKPALGICLGMQMMGLHAGGTLDQHLPDHLPTADDHWHKRAHAIHGELGDGIVHSHHRQALTDPGEMTVIATASDGVIEAVRRDGRAFYLGVQWHPERTDNEQFGINLFRQLVNAAKSSLAVAR